VVRETEERARHLAIATDDPDHAVAKILEEGAGTAKRRGAPDAAAELLLQARRLTPKDRPDEIHRRATEAASFLFVAGDTGRASDLLEETVRASPPGPARARALERLAIARYYGEGPEAARAALEEALHDAGEDQALRSSLHHSLARWWWSIDIEQADTHARAALECAERVDDPRALARALSVVSCSELLLGRGLAEDLIQRAVALERWTEGDRIAVGPSITLVELLMWTDQLDRARGIVTALIGRASDRGEESSLPLLLSRLSELESRAGNWDRALDHSTTGLEALSQSGQEGGLLPDLLFCEALARAHLGESERARTVSARGLALAESSSQQFAAMQNLWVLGFLDLSGGDPAGAVEYLSRARGLGTSLKLRDPGVVPCLPDEFEALVALGELDRARPLIEELEDQGTKLGRAWALGAAARGGGLLEASLGNLEGAINVLRRSVDQLRPIGRPFELGRSLLALGSVFRRNKRKRMARDSLDEALQTFEGLGAALWAERTRAELARIGGRPPGGVDLTETERRVAELAAEGLTNREIADRLFVSVRSVESNLTRTYRKLGVRSRAEMIGRMGRA
jgi:DNA-binding CsgD family transcriptional regulator